MLEVSKLCKLLNFYASRVTVGLMRREMTHLIERGLTRILNNFISLSSRAQLLLKILIIFLFSYEATANIIYKGHDYQGSSCDLI